MKIAVTGASGIQAVPSPNSCPNATVLAFEQPARFRNRRVDIASGHGAEFAFGDPNTWCEPDITIETTARLYGPALIRAWDRLHPKLTSRPRRTG